jgi:hypothetical protein
VILQWTVVGVFRYPVTNKQDFSSLLTEIDLILSGAISSLVNPQEVNLQTIITTRQRLESARVILSTLLFPNTTPEIAHWSLGIDVHREGVKIVFFRERDSVIDLYPLSWSLERGESDYLPWSQVNDYLINWLSNRDFSPESWLFEALNSLEAIVIADDGETPIDDLKNAILTAKLIPSDCLYSLETAIATALAYIPATDQPQAQTILVIEGGWENTTLAMVEVPPQTQSLSRQAIAINRFNYGESTYEREIIYQLIYPLWSSFLPLSFSDLEDSNPIQLDTHPLKKPLLETAKLTKLILQEQTEFTSSLAGHSWTVCREDLKEKVIIPYISNLRQKIDNFLEKQQKSLNNVDQMVFSGDFFLTSWLCLSPVLLDEFSTINLHPPNQENISPVVMGLGRLCLFSGLRTKNGNNT